MSVYLHSLGSKGNLTGKEINFRHAWSSYLHSTSPSLLIQYFYSTTLPVLSLFIFLVFPIFCTPVSSSGFPAGWDGKESACNAGDLGLIPGSERSPEKGNGNPLQYSCLENSMDRGAWQALWSMRSQKVRHDWVTNTHRHTHTHISSTRINYM